MDFLSTPQAISAVLIILAGAIITAVVVRTHREVARKRATLDVILKTEDDIHYQKLFSDFIDMWESKKKFPAHVSAFNKKIRKLYRMEKSGAGSEKEARQLS